MKFCNAANHNYSDHQCTLKIPNTPITSQTWPFKPLEVDVHYFVSWDVGTCWHLYKNLQINENPCNWESTIFPYLQSYSVIFSMTPSTKFHHTFILSGIADLVLLPLNMVFVSFVLDFSLLSQQHANKLHTYVVGCLIG